MALVARMAPPQICTRSQPPMAFPPAMNQQAVQQAAMAQALAQAQQRQGMAGGPPGMPPGMPPMMPPSPMGMPQPPMGMPPQGPPGQGPQQPPPPPEALIAQGVDMIQNGLQGIAQSNPYDNRLDAFAQGVNLIQQALANPAMPSDTGQPTPQQTMMPPDVQGMGGSAQESGPPPAQQ